MFKTLKTDPKISDRLKQAATKELSSEELKKQRISFVFGNMPANSGVTRQQVAQKINNEQK